VTAAGTVAERVLVASNFSNLMFYAGFVVVLRNISARLTTIKAATLICWICPFHCINVPCCDPYSDAHQAIPLDLSIIKSF
jgi:hypothetical protein